MYTEKDKQMDVWRQSFSPLSNQLKEQPITGTDSENDSVWQSMFAGQIGLWPKYMMQSTIQGRKALIYSVGWKWTM